MISGSGLLEILAAVRQPVAQHTARVIATCRQAASQDDDVACVSQRDGAFPNRCQEAPPGFAIEPLTIRGT